MPVEKTCSRCKVTKPIAEFHRNRATPDGYRGDCKACHRTRQKADRERRKVGGKGSSRTLAEFVRDKKRANCPVCKLPERVRSQLREAREKKITRDVQLEWLRSEHSSDLTTSDLDSHSSGRHDNL